MLELVRRCLEPLVYGRMRRGKNGKKGQDKRTVQGMPQLT
jgi:hypothetical protein